MNATPLSSPWGYKVCVVREQMMGRERGGGGGEGRARRDSSIVTPSPHPGLTRCVSWVCATSLS